MFRCALGIQLRQRRRAIITGASTVSRRSWHQCSGDNWLPECTRKQSATPKAKIIICSGCITFGVDGVRTILPMAIDTLSSTLDLYIQDTKPTQINTQYALIDTYFTLFIYLFILPIFFPYRSVELLIICNRLLSTVDAYSLHAY